MHPCKTFFGCDGFQNMFVYQPTFNMLELKEDKGTEYITAWKSEGLSKSRLYPLYLDIIHYKTVAPKD